MQNASLVGDLYDNTNWMERDFPALKYYRFPMIQWGKTVQHGLISRSCLSKMSLSNSFLRISSQPNIIEGEGLFYAEFALD